MLKMSLRFIRHVNQKILSQEADNIDRWTQAFEDGYSEDGDNVWDDIKIGDEESSLDRERPQTTEYQTQEIFTCSELQDISAVDNEKVDIPS